MIKIVIPLEPVAQGRPKFSSRSGFVKAYDPSKSRDYKKQVREIALEQYKEFPFASAVKIDVTFYRRIQKSTTKTMYLKKLSGEILPIIKPDVDNYFKAVTDALKGIVWVDDNQITDVGMHKRYSDNPRTEINIWPL